jgi:hypothetical protein
VDLERPDDSDRAGGLPNDVTPDNIRVSDREREHVASLLGQAAGEGRLTLDEYADRVDRAYAAKTRGELAPLLADLPVTQQPYLAGQPAAAVDSQLAPLGVPLPAESSGRGERLMAIFGEDVRKGRWIVPATVEARAIFGSCELHFQDAQILHQVTRVEATAMFGSVELYIPEGVDVRLSGAAVFGAKSSMLRQPPRPGAPVIEVVCRIGFGSVEVKPPKRRWFAKD